MNSILNILKLTDRYEVKARLIPALISCLGAVPAIGAVFSSSVPNGIMSLSLSGGVFVVLAVGLSYGASLAGRKYERRLWPRWPCDAPTNAWLLPGDSHSSPEQKCLWYGAVERLTELNIGQAAARGDKENLERVINDAVVDLRAQFRTQRQTEVGSMLAIQNEDYGFARNLTGLRVVWFSACIFSAIVGWLGYLLIDTWLGWGALAIFVLVLAIYLFFTLPAYVRERADRYAEGFFGQLMALDRLNSAAEE